MSRRGNFHDNAVAESFFQLLKRERIKRRICPTRDEARADVFDYIELFYNTARREGYNDGLSPVKYEQRESERLGSVWDIRGNSPLPVARLPILGQRTRDTAARAGQHGINKATQVEDTDGL